MARKKKISIWLTGILFIGLFYILLIAIPYPLFACKYEYENFRIYSDEEIPREIEIVLDKAKASLIKSELYDPNYVFKIMICHNENLFAFFTRNRNAGGLVQGVISPNVFLREANIKENQIIPPGGWMFDMDERPLSYFIAHECTHSLQAKFDRFMIFKTPPHIMEGYADYIGKNESYDYQEYRKMFLDHDPKMKKDSPLYNRYHLYIAYLIDKKNLSFKEILKFKPKLDLVLEEIESERENF